MKRTAIAALVMLVVGLSALPVLAQTTGFGDPMGWLFISDDPTTYSPNISSGAFLPFTVYLMTSMSYSYLGDASLDIGTGIQAYEASLNIPGLGGDVVIQNTVIRNESLNIGNDTNLIVGLTSAGIKAAETPIDLVEYTMLLLADGLEDIVITIGAATPSSFTPAAPGYSETADIGECINPVNGQGIECKRRFALVSPGVINCVNECITPKATEEKSWGAIKAQY